MKTFREQSGKLLATFDSPTKHDPMAYSRNSNYQPIAKNRIAYRYRQALVLIATILFGMIISAAVNAIPSSKKTSVATKAPQETSISNTNKTD